MSHFPFAFEIELEPETLIVTLPSGLGGAADESLEREFDQIRGILGGDDVKHVVVDLGKTDRMDRAVARSLRKIAELSRKRSGRAALCGLSEDQMETIKEAGLDQCWHIFMSREEALESVGTKDLAPPGVLGQDAVHEASEESFPASDAPAWTGTSSVGGPTAEGAT